MSLGSISILVFALLVLVGGIIGFKKAKSKASLIASAISAILLAICFWLSHHHAEAGYKLTFIVTGILEGIFVMRLMKTKKFMPSGLMLILCALEQIVLFVALKGL